MTILIILAATPERPYILLGIISGRKMIRFLLFYFISLFMFKLCLQY